MQDECKTNSCFVTVRDVCKYRNKYQSILKNCNLRNFFAVIATAAAATSRPLARGGNNHPNNGNCGGIYGDSYGSGKKTTTIAAATTTWGLMV
jgi:hypothetical protein